MGRGSANQAESILYGATGPRCAVDDLKDYQLDLGVGVVGHFDGDSGNLTRLELDADAKDVSIGAEGIDGPAVVFIKDKRQVRDDKNALTFSDDLELHREDGPAVIYDDGGQEWWRHGQLHRDGEPAVTRSDGNMLWYVEGELHREGGPAEIFNDVDGVVISRWMQYGLTHRDDGPAVEYEGVDAKGEYWLYGERYLQKEDWERALEDGP